MRIISTGLLYSGVEETFEKFFTDPVAILRLLHYPPGVTTSASDETEKRKQLGSSAHTDFGAVTLLLQDENAGLQVQDPMGSGEWISVPPQKGAYVVNTVDMLTMWTKYKYKSSVHRVVNESVSDRYSIVFFLDGNLNMELKPLDNGSWDGEEGVQRTVESIH